MLRLSTVDSLAWVWYSLHIVWCCVFCSWENKLRHYCLYLHILNICLFCAPSLDSYQLNCSEAVLRIMLLRQFGPSIQLYTDRGHSMEFYTDAMRALLNL